MPPFFIGGNKMKKSERGVSVNLLMPLLTTYPPTVIFKSTVDTVTNYLSTMNCDKVVKLNYEETTAFYIKDYHLTMSVLDVVKMLNEKLYMDNGGRKQRYTHDKMKMTIEAAYAKYLSHHTKFHSSN